MIEWESREELEATPAGTPQAAACGDVTQQSTLALTDFVIAHRRT